jgi:hypothetical protein
VLPLLVAAGIEATREHTDKGTAMALRKVPRNDVSNVREGESGEHKPKTTDINRGLMSGSNVSPNLAETKASDTTDITDIRYRNSWESDPMRFYESRGGAT